MIPVRWLLIFTTGLFILLATAAVQAFRLRDAPPKALASENIIKKVVSQTKCDTCDKSSVDISNKIVKIKAPIIHKFDEKISNVLPNKLDIVSKKGVTQIRPGFRIKVFKKDESEDEDTEDEDDDSETEMIDTDGSEDEDESDDGNSLDEEDNEDDSETEDDDDADDDSENDEEDESDIEITPNKKPPVPSKIAIKISHSDDDDDDDDDDDEDDDDSDFKKKSNSAESDNDRDDDDDEDDDDEDDDDDDDESDEDNDEISDDNDDDGNGSENENPDDEDSDSEKSDSDDDKLLIIKSNLKSSIKTVENLLKETSKTSKIIPPNDKPTSNIKHESTVQKSNTAPPSPKKEDPKVVAKKEEPKVAVKKEEPKVVVKKEEPKVVVKKEEPKVVIQKEESKPEKINPAVVKNEKVDSKKDGVKDLPIKDIKKEPKKDIVNEVKPTPKEVTPKPELKKDVPKLKPKAEDIKPEIKKVDVKHTDTKSTKNVKEVESKPESKKISHTENRLTDHSSKPKSDIKKVEVPRKESQSQESKIKMIHSKKDVHESHVHEAIHRKNLRESDFEDFYTFFPTFAPNFSRIHNPECRRQGQILIRQLKGAKIWPLQMLDSTAKLPSGLLKGNGNQFGDYDQCVATNARVRLSSGSVVKVAGKYCLAQIDLKPISEETKLPVHLAQARNFIRSAINDPGHFIPRFTSLNWGICLPAACDAPEAEFIMRDALRHYNGTIGMRIIINVDPINCYTEETNAGWAEWMDIPTIGTLSFYAAVIAITAYATITDVLSSRKNETDEANEEEKEKSEDENNDAKLETTEETEDNTEKTSETANESSFVKCFSLKQTTGKLLNDASAEGDIECIHGIRALCSIALYIAHKLIPLAMTPFSNRVILTEISNSPFSVALRASLLYTDSFLLLSGVLTAYHMSQDLDRTGSIPWLKRFIARYIRLTPALLAVLLWYSWISDKIGDGPLWGTIVTQNAELCQSNMWQNLFYIQNFFSFEDMCATHTHQLALDMQLWWLAPVSVWILRSKPTWALAVLGGLHAFTVWLRYSTTQSEFLSLVIYHGISVNQLYRTANLCYSLALHRATPYLAGISLGVLLQQTGKDFSLSKFFSIPGWLISLYFGIWALYTPAHLAMRDYQYDVNEASQYAALASVAWALSLSWVIFACFTGYGGFLNKVLCSKPLAFLSRISYSMYLCQFLVFFYNVGSTRTSSEFSLISAINIVELFTIIIISTIITLLLDIPMQGAKKSIMSIKFSKTEEVNEENVGEENQEDVGANPEEAEVTEAVEEETIQEEEIQLEESAQEEIYEYDEDQLEHQHYQIEQDVIYEEEEEYDPEMEQGDFDEEQEEGIYEEDETADDRQEDKPSNDNDNGGEDDEDLQEWEWTNGELCYYPRR